MKAKPELEVNGDPIVLSLSERSRVSRWASSWGGFSSDALRVPAVDVLSLAVTAGLMLLAMALACIAPARRVIRERPTRLLRDDVT